MSFQIIGTGKAHPQFSLTNDQLSTIVDTNDEWITSRSGIKTRFIATTETGLELTATASNQALANAGIAAADLDLIICATLQGDNVTPSLACMVQQEIGAHCPAFDLNAACTGFIYALDVAAAYLDSGRADKVLVVACEIMSKHLDWNHRSTCVLFGDGAGAVVLQKGDGLLARVLTAQSDTEEALLIPGFNNINPFSQLPHRPNVLSMSGRKVFKFAVGAMVKDVKKVLAQTGLTPAQIKMVIPHQANIRIIQSAARLLGFTEEQTAIGIQHYGNTSSASIPLLLDDLWRQGKIQKGDIIVLSAFGGGFTTGACIIKL